MIHEQPPGEDHPIKALEVVIYGIVGGLTLANAAWVPIDIRLSDAMTLEEAGIVLWIPLFWPLVSLGLMFTALRDQLEKADQE